MEIFELILLLLAAILVSAVLDQIVPRIALPLIQIALGVILVLFAGGPLDISVDPELFLVLFIAPLLFDEARHASKEGLWKNKGAIVSLAIGLVLVTMLVVGFVLHLVEPSISLAAAFALGAALGPTDAVAVTALAKDIRLTHRQESLLSGEALINDASGVVSFQFAIAAAVTGAFSALDAATTFVVDFFGGIIIGIIAGVVAALVLRALRKRGFESATVHVVFEVLTPFAVYLLAENFHTSGILAVVAAGLTMTLMPKRVSATSARLRIASTSVWETLVFVVNGVVFVLLGMQLPQTIIPGWNDNDSNPFFLIGLVLLVSVIVMGVRFIWVFVLNAVGRDEKDQPRRGFSGRSAHDALVTTLSGPKGAVTLSIILTIPYVLSSGESFPQRSEIIFLASGVILCTLLMANFVVPLLSPQAKIERDDKKDDKARIAILQAVIRELQDHKDSGTAAASRTVIRHYAERIRRIRVEHVTPAYANALRADALSLQRACVENYRKEHPESGEECERTLSRIDRSRALLRRSTKLQSESSGVLRRFRLWLSTLASAISRLLHRSQESSEEYHASRQLSIELEHCALNFYEEKAADPDPEVARAARLLISETKTALLALEPSGYTSSMPPVDAAAAKEQVKSMLEATKEIEEEAFRLELDQIQYMSREGIIDRELARDLREEVYLLQLASRS